MPKEQWKSEDLKDQYEAFQETLNLFNSERNDKNNVINHVMKQGKELVQKTHNFMRRMEELDNLYAPGRTLREQSADFKTLAKEMTEEAYELHKEAWLWDVESDDFKRYDSNDDAQHCLFFYKLADKFENFPPLVNERKDVEEKEKEYDAFYAIRQKADRMLDDIEGKLENPKSRNDNANNMSVEELTKLAEQKVAVGIMFHDAVFNDWGKKKLYDPNNPPDRGTIRDMFEASVQNMTKQIRLSKLITNKNDTLAQQNLNNMEHDVDYDGYRMPLKLADRLMQGSQTAVKELTGKDAKDAKDLNLSVDKALLPFKPFKQAYKKKEQARFKQKLLEGLEHKIDGLKDYDRKKPRGWKNDAIYSLWADIVDDISVLNYIKINEVNTKYKNIFNSTFGDNYLTGCREMLKDLEELDALYDENKADNAQSQAFQEKAVAVHKKSAQLDQQFGSFLEKAAEISAIPNVVDADNDFRVFMESKGIHYNMKAYLPSAAYDRLEEDGDKLRKQAYIIEDHMEDCVKYIQKKAEEAKSPEDRNNWVAKMLAVGIVAEQYSRSPRDLDNNAADYEKMVKKAFNEDVNTIAAEIKKMTEFSEKMKGIDDQYKLEVDLIGDVLLDNRDKEKAIKMDIINSGPIMAHVKVFGSEKKLNINFNNNINNNINNNFNNNINNNINHQRRGRGLGAG